jgi:hypothetical protein
MAPSRTSDRNRVSNLPQVSTSRLTEVHLGWNDPTIPTVAQLDRAIHRTINIKWWAVNWFTGGVYVPNKEADRAEYEGADHNLHSWIKRLSWLFIEWLADRVIGEESQEELRCTDDVNYEWYWWDSRQQFRDAIYRERPTQLEHDPSKHNISPLELKL